MTISETITIQAATPPTDLPHDTASAEVARLPDYLSGVVERDDGTDYVVTSAAYKDAAGNAGRVYIALDADTNEILAIQSKVGGVWKNWLIGTDSLADGAVTGDKIADQTIPGFKLADDIAGGGIKFTDTVEDDVTTRVAEVAADGTSLEVNETTGELGIKEKATGVSLYNPNITWHALFNSGEVNEFCIGSNTEGTFSQAYLNAVNGVPIRLYNMPTDGDATLGLYSFEKQQATFEQNGSTLKLSIDSNSNVFYETLDGLAQNQVWKSSRITTASGGLAVGVAMMLTGNGTLLLRRLNVTDFPTSSSGLSTGDVWNDSGALKVV